MGHQPGHGGLFAATRRTAAILMVFTAIAFGIGPLAEAQNKASMVFLKAGPRIGQGIPYLGLNVVPYDYGEYAFTDYLVGVYFSRQVIPALSEWVKKDCHGRIVYELPADKERVISYSTEAGWTVIVSFRSEKAPVVDRRAAPLPEDACRFMDVFIPRLEYFLSAGALSGTSPLPAVLDFR
jgi:hypothetical protein